MNRALNTSMMIGTIFGWVWMFATLNDAHLASTLLRVVVTVIAVLLYGWIVFIRRKSRKAVTENPTSEKSMFVRRSYFLTVAGEVFLILIVAFLLQQTHLQIFILSAIAIVVALHFIILGLFLRIRYLQAMGWFMVIFLIISNFVFAPMSRLTANQLTVGFGMGLILWASVVISMIRATRGTDHT